MDGWIDEQGLATPIAVVEGADNWMGKHGEWWWQTEIIMFVRWKTQVSSLITFRQSEETQKINPRSPAPSTSREKKQVSTASQLDGLYNHWILPAKWWRDFLGRLNEDSIALLLLVILLSCCQSLGALHLFHIGTKKNEWTFILFCTRSALRRHTDKKKKMAFVQSL